MPAMSSQQREWLIETLTDWLRAKIGDASNDVQFEMQNGLQETVGADLAEGRLSANGSATLTVRINGGAQHTRELAEG